ncbi:hypothetical protein BJ170DRAFT_380675 [Xylariales sp. AK1849]|nr:hypothetical protein BJ170DRAFT_380675 [Xylariales sp. AK1849]
MVSTTENRGPQLATVDYTFAILAFATIVLRCSVRVFIVRSFGLDDWLMVIAAVLFILYCSFSITGVHYGTGQHEADLPHANVARARSFWWLCYLMYALAMIFSKISIGCLLLRVAVRRLHTWIIYGAMTITVVTCAVFFFVTVFQCQPVSYFWEKHQDGSCVNIEVIIGLAYLYSSCAVLTDFTFALLPAWIIMGLQLKTRTKLALIPLMALGCVASAAVVVRFAYLTRFRDPDFLWATVDIAIWSTVEQGLAVAAGSLATLRPLAKLIGWKLGFTNGPSAAYGSEYGKMGNTRGSQADQLNSRRRGSQNAVDVLRLDNLKGDARSGVSVLARSPSAYQVSCQAGAHNNYGQELGYPNAIAQGKSYEVSTEYVVSPIRASENEKGNLPSPSNRQGTQRWPEREQERNNDSDSIEELRREPSRDIITEHAQAVPRSFLMTDERSQVNR